MKKYILNYEQGQWFAVPLRKGGYALGIVARGSHKSKGGLGYFFGPKYENIPDDKDTWKKKADQAILVTRFGDLGIINGSWPLIQSTRPFHEEEWPIPKFGVTVSLLPGKGFIRKYSQNENGEWKLIQEKLVDVDKIANLPEDGLMGGGAVEIRLTEILS